MKARYRLLLALAIVLTGCTVRPADLPVHVPDIRPLLAAPIPDLTADAEPHARTRSAESRPVPPEAADVKHQPPAQRLEPRRADQPLQVPVLLYHDLAPGARGGNGVIIDVAEFEWQMAWLAQNGYTPVSSAALTAWLQGKGKLPPRPVQIQFDDGYRSNYTYALPIMQKHGMRGIIFLVTGFPEDQGFLTGAQIREMKASGLFEFHGHGHEGHGTTAGVANLVAWDARQIRSDYRAMLDRFAGAGLPAPTAYAYPFGAHDDEAVSALRSEGVTAGFTVQPGYVRSGDDPLRLKRQIIWPGITPCRFADLVRGEANCS